MNIAYQDGWAALYQGDCRDVLRELPAGSVHMIITSPPYWGLRFYGIPPSVWGGDSSHTHVWGSEQRGKRKDILPPEESESESRMGTDERQGVGPLSGGRFCECGAWSGTLGNEPSPELYVANLVEIFEEVKRVLRADGTLWLILGRSMWGSGGAGGDYGDDGIRAGQPRWKQGSRHVDRESQAARLDRQVEGSWKPKDLVPTDWLTALALQRAGWWLRSSIVWAKTSAMPQSVTDRPTNGHELIFLLTKSGDPLYWTHRDLPGTRQRPEPDYRWVNVDTGEERDTAPEGWVSKARPRVWRRINLWTGHDYYYDRFGYAEPSSGQKGRAADFQRQTKEATVPGQAALQHRMDRVATGDTGTRNVRDFWVDEGGKQAEVGNRQYTGFNARWDAAEANGQVSTTANLRDFWLLGPEVLREAHYAAYPTEIPRRTILLGSSAKGVCGDCGAPWQRVAVRRLLDPNRPQTRRALQLAERAGLTEVHFAAIRAVGITDEGTKNRSTSKGYGKNTPEIQRLADEAKQVLGGYYREFLLGAPTPRIDYDGKNADLPAQSSHRRLLAGVQGARAAGGDHDNPFPPKETVGWQPTCEHVDAEVVPATVLDPFAGSGTTLMVAKQLGRRSIGIELSESYSRLASKRISSVTLPMEVGV